MSLTTGGKGDTRTLGRGKCAPHPSDGERAESEEQGRAGGEQRWIEAEGGGLQSAGNPAKYPNKVEGRKKPNQTKTKSNIRRSAGLSPLQKRPILPRRRAQSRRQHPVPACRRRQSSPAAAFPPLPPLRTELSSRCTSLETMTWRPPPGKLPETGELLRV